VSGRADGVRGLGPRDVAHATGKSYELIVVGGGVHGLCATLHAARAGVRVLLIERDDFASHTSANSLQILHGGFRYLQSLDWKRLRESARARAWWMEHFPDLTAPLECVLPLDGRGVRRPEIFRAALALHHRLARQRPALPEGRVERASARPELAALFGSPPRNFAVWFDGLFPRPGRLALELLRWAMACGADALSHVEARELLIRRSDGGRSEVAGVRAFDRESGREIELHAPRVLNYAGPWIAWTGSGPLHPPSVAFNLLFRGELPGGSAVAARARDGKNLFLWEREGCIHAGTRHLPWPVALSRLPAAADRAPTGPVDRADIAPGDRPRVDPAHIDALIDDLRTALPGLGFEKRDLLAMQIGFLPARARGDGEMAQRDRFLDHASRGGPAGLFSVSGIKYTTAPVVAERALRRMFRSNLLATGPRRTLDLQEGGRVTAAAADAAAVTIGESATTVGEIARLLEESPQRAARELQRLIDEEMALHLDDLILGRLDGIHLGSALLPLGQRIAALLGWAPERSARELARLESRLAAHAPTVRIEA